MLRSLILGLSFTAAAGGAQTLPTAFPNSQPMQPGPPPAQPLPATDPNAIPLAPPSFAPGVSSNETSPTPRPHAIRISGGVMAGQLLAKTEPVYPDEAHGIAGAIVMSAHIGKDGHIINLAVVSGPQVLQAAAINAVKRWIYKPYLLNGEPVDVMTTIVVNMNPAYQR